MGGCMRPAPAQRTLWRHYAFPQSFAHLDLKRVVLAHYGWHIPTPEHAPRDGRAPVSWPP